MTLRGKDADAFLEEIRRRNAAIEAENLDRGKADAAARGKEPFDLEKLETLCDTSSEGRVAPYETRHAHYEYMYYVNHPELMTIADLAALVEQLNKW